MPVCWPIFSFLWATFFSLLVEPFSFCWTLLRRCRHWSMCYVHKNYYQTDSSFIRPTDWPSKRKEIGEKERRTNVRQRPARQTHWSTRKLNVVLLRENNRWSSSCLEIFDYSTGEREAHDSNAKEKRQDTERKTNLIEVFRSSNRRFAICSIEWNERTMLVRVPCVFLSQFPWEKMILFELGFRRWTNEGDRCFRRSRPRSLRMVWSKRSSMFNNELVKTNRNLSVRVNAVGKVDVLVPYLIEILFLSLRCFLRWLN